MKAFLDKIFKLPPVEEREIIWSTWLGRNLSRTGDNTDDHGYIFYLMLRTIAYSYCAIGAPLFVLYLVGWEVSFPLFKLTGPEVHHLEGIFTLFSNIMAVLGLGCIYPFFLVMYLYNINPKKFDILQFNPNYKKNRSRWKIIPIAMMGFIICPLMLLYGHFIRKAPFLSLAYTETVISFAVYFFFGAIWTIMGILALIVVTVLLIRYIGPCEGP